MGHRPFNLDHLGFLTHDLDAAAQAMERLGFFMAPLSFHRENLSSGAPQKTGTANRCMMFRCGYVEMLGIVDPRRYSGWIRDALRRYEGLHVIGFGHEDLQGLLASLAATNRKPPVRKLSRALEIGGEERTVAFTLLLHSGAESPEARFVTLEHHTREVLWHPSLLDHPNGAVALAGVTLVVAAPGEFSARVAAWTGASPVGAAGRLRIDLPGGFIEALSEAEARDEYGAALPSPLPPVVGMTIAVTDLAATARRLRERQVEYRCTGSSILVSASHCCGAFIHFIQEV